ncbi:hypothetical protein HY449_04260 [Candidatus Pacearchaeota archaeon]|nr:hypothetical protein [Candidatus Pacearchaeota archaeon]
MSKLKTPDWVLEGYKSEDEYNKAKGIKKKMSAGKTFKIRKCPKCGSDEISVVLGFDEGKGKGEWECRKCKWVGKNLNEEDVSEEEFMKYLEEKEK